MTEMIRIVIRVVNRTNGRHLAVIQRGVGGVTKGQAVTYTLSDAKKIQKVADDVTGTRSMVSAVSLCIGSGGFLKDGGKELPVRVMCCSPF
jgi:NADH:ubiquinone oxidoreductase subunit D